MSFVEEIAPHAQEIGIENDILPSLIIGQAILESASGTSELAQKGKNLFGIKGSYNGQSVTILTTEFVNGEKVKVNAAFCKYPSWRESIEALANKYVNGVSWNRDLYRAVVGEKDYKKAAKAVHAAGYATDPAYPNKVINVIEKYNLTKYDQLERVDNMVAIKQQLIDPGKYSIKCPNAMNAEYITVHNTANDAPAANEISYMQRNNNQVSFHFAVDDKEIIQGLPLNRNAWHCGDGNGNGNRKSIGVEICYSKSGGERYKKAEENAILLIAQLLKERGWGIDRVKKHQDWNGKYCPHRILAEGRWEEFKKRIADKLKQKEAPTLDKNKPSVWAKKDWDEAVKNKYLDGTRPHDNMTRQELAIVINRLRNNLLPLIWAANLKIEQLEKRIKELENKG